MDRRRLTLASLFTLLAVVGALLVVVAESQPGALAPEPLTSGITAADTATMGQFPVSFERNEGQASDDVAFVARSAGYRLDLHATEVALTVGQPRPAQIRMELVDANPDARVRGHDVLPGQVNHINGNDPEQWHLGIPTFASVVHEAVYPGIDLVVRGDDGAVEYDFVVAPGADPDLVALAFAGVDDVTLDPSGDLVLTAANQTVVHRRPFIYQQIAGERVAVAGGFAIDARGDVGFDVAGYDSSLPLVIDPVIEYSTTLGGSGEETAYGVAVDVAGNAYVAGYTTSTDFPSTTATMHGGAWDVFVAKLDPVGQIVYATYVGGTGLEVPDGIVIDDAGNAYIAGITTSTDYPLMVPAQGSPGGGFDTFITKLDSSGGLAYSTYLGGDGDDNAAGLALDDAGKLYVAGHTSSTIGFPNTSGGYQASYAGGTFDAFLVVVAPTGSSFEYATLLGGTAQELTGGVAIGSGTDPVVSVVGTTGSQDFPLRDAYQPGYGENHDVFVAQLDPSVPVAGDQLVWSTFLGGSDRDIGRDIAMDGEGSIYVTGWSEALTTPPHPYEFPTTSGAFDEDHDGGPWDSFVSKLSADGSDLVYSTFLGGTTDDYALGIAVNDFGEAHVAGWTTSTDFPTVDSILAGGHSGDGDSFLARLSADGSLLAYSGLFGGNLHDAASHVALDAIGTAYMSGTSYVTGAADADAWVNKLSPTTGDAIYVWRAPGRKGTPITEAEAERLADFAVAEGIGTIFYDNWGCGILPADPTDPDTFTSLCPTGWPEGSEHQDATTLASIIRTFHDHGLRVEALYTDNGTRNIGGVPVSRVEEVVLYNASVLSGQQFDAVRLNDETFVCAPQHGTDGPSLDDCTVPLSDPPITVNDFDELEGAVADSGSLPIYMSVGHTWTNTDDLLELFDGIDVQVAQDNQVGYNTYDGRAIERLSADEICDGNTQSKPVHVTIETYDVKTHLGMSDHNTFYEEGRANMLTTLEKLDFTAEVTPRDYVPPCPQPEPHGIAYHFYRESYGSPILPGWAPDSDGDGVADEIDPTAGGGLPSQFSDSLVGGTTSGEITDVGNQVLMVADALDSGDGVIVTSLYDEPNDGIVRDQPATVTFNPGVGGDCTATPTPPNPTSLMIKADTQVVVTCGSLKVAVVHGNVETAFTASDGTIATTTMEEGNEVTFEPETATFTAPPSNPDPVVVTVDGKQISVEPGETVNADAAITSVTGPLAPLEVGAVVAMSATLANPDPGGLFIATWDWGDGTTSGGAVDADEGTVDGDHTYATPGVYAVTLTVSDDQGGSDSRRFEFIVAYDPDAGFVTGGGWFDSPPGALVADPLATGKANFGYVAKYKKGQTVPDGQTQFQFKAGDLELHSTEYDWLVVTGNDTARFKGSGTINGEGEYKFQIWAYDEPDAIRIKIWSEDEAGNETPIYDTDVDDTGGGAIELGGGNIQVHAD